MVGNAPARSANAVLTFPFLFGLRYFPCRTTTTLFRPPGAERPSVNEMGSLSSLFPKQANRPHAVNLAVAVVRSPWREGANESARARVCWGETNARFETEDLLFRGTPLVARAHCIFSPGGNIVAARSAPDSRPWSDRVVRVVWKHAGQIDDIEHIDTEVA
jgi:hypothetical protein